MVCLAVVGLVSCKNEVEPAQEELVSVSFEKGSSRALTATLEDFDVDDFYWSYQAKKNDGSGLKSGETTWDDTGAGSVIVQTGKGLNYGGTTDPVKIPGFSKGYWDFRLFAYTDAERTKLAYWGEADYVLIDSTHHLASVTVNPVSTGTGYLKIGTITFVPASDISIPTDLVVYTDEVFELEGSVWVPVSVQPEGGIYTLPAKQYKFTRTYSYEGIPVANGSVIATVYSNLTTTVSGTLSELTTYVEFDADQNPDIVRETWGTSVIDEDATGTINFQKNLDPAATEKVASATMPAEAAVAKLAELEEVVGADDGSSSTLKLNLSVDTTDVKQQSVTYDIGMEAVLTYTKNQIQSVAKSDVKNVTKYVLIDINLTSDISDVTVTHSGEAMILTDDMSRAGEQGETDPKYVDINKGTTDDPLWVGFYQLETTSTGKVLHLKTKSFSPFEVTYAMTNYVAAIGNVKYTTLTAAIAAANPGDTIIILSDITTDAGYLVEKTLSIHTNGHTITVNEGANINNRAFKVTSGKLSVYGGGTIDAKGASGTGCYGAFRAEVGTELILEGITLKNYRNNGLNVKILGGKATLTNVTINSSLGGGIEVTEANLGTQSQTGSATLNDCTFTQTGYSDWCSTALSVSGGSKLVVNSGTYSGEYGLYVFSSGGEIEVNGGSFEGKSENVLIAAIDTSTYPQYVGGFKISGGEFTGTFAITSPAYMSITGGTFDHDPSDYVAEGYIADYNSQTQKWTVREATEDDYVASVTQGELVTKYFSLQSAVAAANAGDTVTLLKSISTTDPISLDVSKALTINGDNKTITRELDETEGTYVVKVYNSTGSSEADNVNVTLTNLNIEATNSRGIDFSGYLNVEFDGGVINVVNNCAISFGNGIDGPVRGEVKNITSTMTGDNPGQWSKFNDTALAVAGGAEVCIKSGSFTGPNAVSVWTSGGTLTIEGGSFTTNATPEQIAYFSGHYLGNSLFADAAGSVPAQIMVAENSTATFDGPIHIFHEGGYAGARIYINGGSFTNYEARRQYSTTIVFSYGDIISITGGIFDANPNGSGTGNDLIADGYYAKYHPAAGTDSEYWTVEAVPANAIFALIDNTTNEMSFITASDIESLTGFEDGVPGNHTLKLLKDYTFTTNDNRFGALISFYEDDITLDLNNHTLTVYAESIEALFDVKWNTKNLTFKNGKISNGVSWFAKLLCPESYALASVEFTSTGVSYHEVYSPWNTSTKMSPTY